MINTTSAQYQWYQMAAKVKFLEISGNEFEVFFKQFMTVKYGPNFIGSTPWGDSGDGACDGYLLCNGNLFQCYSPKTLTASNMKKKIDGDFKRAKKLWSQLKKWTFVFSHQEITCDIPSIVAQYWTEFVAGESESENPIEISFWSTSFLMNEILTLDSEQLKLLFGPMPTDEGISRVTPEIIDTVLGKILTLIEMNTALDSDLDLRAVPVDKISINNLNSINQEFLFSGEKKSYYIEMYIRKSGNEKLIDDLSSTFRLEYNRYKDRGFDSNSIFFKLIMFMGYGDTTSDVERGALLAIITYLFNNCTIFERK